MTQHRLIGIALCVLSLATAACTLLLDRSSEQCSTNADCEGLLAGSICQAKVCVLPDGGGGAYEGPKPFEDCFEGTPTTPEELQNSCDTAAECVKFDNCDKLGLCDGGLLGTLPPEATGGSTTSDASAPPGTPTCAELAAAAGVTPIYVTGSSNFPPFLNAIAPVLAAGDDPHGVVWQTSNSCAGVDAIYNEYVADVPDPGKRIMKERLGRTTLFFDRTGASKTCVIDGEVVADVGESDIYPKTCAETIKYDPVDPNKPRRANVAEYLGPIMAMSFIVPAASKQTVISAEAAQAVFGRGGVPDPTKLPWTNQQNFFNRASSTATNQIISLGIFVDPTKWWGVDKRTASEMVDAMGLVPESLAEQTLGIISADFASLESSRGVVKTLAFQARGQRCGFYPDSKPNIVDRLAVRDGHYPLWGPLHFFIRWDPIANAPRSTAAAAFVREYGKPRLDKDLVTRIIHAGNVPACAMHVKRDYEMGPIRREAPPYSCSCLYDSLTSRTSCQACNVPSECPSGRPASNYGFCEPN